MNWIVFSYSLPSQASTPRVTLWRRLRRLGAISPTGSVFILPANDESVEAFQWLAQEIQQADGEALVMQVNQFEGMTDNQIIDLFNQERQVAYDDISVQLEDLEGKINTGFSDDDFSYIQAAIQKIQKQLSEVYKVDYFQCAGRLPIEGKLNQIIERISPEREPAPMITAVTKEQYQNGRWVTRPRPHVDRLACIWFIRRYLNPEAVIRFSTVPELGEIAFDMDGGEFSHKGNFCSFEVMIRAFGIDERALYLLAEVVHEIDLRDGRYQRPETPGVDAALRGWLMTNLSDQELETFGLALFDGLFTTFSYHSANPLRLNDKNKD